MVALVVVALAAAAAALVPSLRFSTRLAARRATLAYVSIAGRLMRSAGGCYIIINTAPS